MRRATLADVRAVARIFIKEMRFAWPEKASQIGEETARTFIERCQLPGAIVCVNDDVTAFILTHRHNKMLWEVCVLHPHDIFFETMGKVLVGFAFITEHKLRPFVPDTVDAAGKLIRGTETYADLTLGGANVEAATADAYKIGLNTDLDEITDTTGAVRIKRLHLTASQVASRYGFTL